MMLPRTFALGSLGISLVVVLIKGLAFHLTGSVALLSDALESVVNVATALASLAAIRFSAGPRIRSILTAITRPSASRPSSSAC